MNSYNNIAFELQLTIQMFMDWKSIIALSKCSKQYHDIYKKYMLNETATRVAQYLIAEYKNIDCKEKINTIKPSHFRMKVETKYYFNLDIKASDMWMNEISINDADVDDVINCYIGSEYKLCHEFMMYYISYGLHHTARTVDIPKLGELLKIAGPFEHGDSICNDFRLRMLSIITCVGFTGFTELNAGHIPNGCYYIRLSNTVKGSFVFTMKKNNAVAKMIFQWVNNKGFCYKNLCDVSLSNFAARLAKCLKLDNVYQGYDFIENMRVLPDQMFCPNLFN